MRGTKHAVVRRDPSARQWWWVCVEPNCPLDSGIGTQIADHRGAITAATAHVVTARMRRTSPVSAASPAAAASGRGSVGGDR